MYEQFNKIPSEGKSKKADDAISRRNLLKLAAVAAVGAPLVAAVAKLGFEEMKGEEELKGEGTILKMKFIPAHGEFGGAGVYSMRYGNIPDEYVIRLNTDNGPAWISVSKGEFESYSIGEKVIVNFRRHPLPAEATLHKRGLRLESIKKIKRGSLSG